MPGLPQISLPQLRKPLSNFSHIMTKTRVSGFESESSSSGHSSDRETVDSDNLRTIAEFPSVPLTKVEVAEIAWARGLNGKWRRVIIEDNGSWDLGIDGKPQWTYRASWMRERIVFHGHFSPAEGELVHDTPSTQTELEERGGVMEDVQASNDEVASPESLLEGDTLGDRSEGKEFSSDARSRTEEWLIAQGF
ncbi:hypothetical protein K488DRAFT_74709 [Vararia minispora EC-137]|uniref:Uncharacterized protein n=1 Tax=Vararia minispora EC-137 TaxID=1314806 RepID=A0ACB8Q749_9AGAM|nr:hypothetical protein K488DRAFT_74709 [Vararia minispora EC-137]